MPAARFCPQCGSDDIEGDANLGYVCFGCRQRFSRPTSSDEVQVRHTGGMKIGSEVFVCEQCSSKSPTISTTEYKCGDCGKRVCPRCAGQEGVAGVLGSLGTSATYCGVCRTRRAKREATKLLTLTDEEKKELATAAGKVGGVLGIMLIIFIVVVVIFAFVVLQCAGSSP